MADEEIKQEIQEEKVEEIVSAEPQEDQKVSKAEVPECEATDEVCKEPIVEEPEKKVEEPSDDSEASDKGDTESDKGEDVKKDDPEPEVKEEKDEPEIPAEPTEPTEPVAPAEPTVDEKLAEAERRIAEFEEQRAEAESLQRLDDVDKAIAQHIKETEQAVIKSMEDMAKKYGIPTDISMEELEKQDPTKAAIAKEIAQNAQRVMAQKQQEMEQAREMEAAKLVFGKAEKLFDKHKLTQEQAEVAADTFIAIVKETGVQDLGEDLKNKVELAVAKALMQVPVVMEVHDKIEEIKKEEKEPATDTTVLENTSPEIVVEPEPKVEVKDEVPPPDLSEFMEDATSSSPVENPDAVTADNVLQKLASLPFRERTRFLAEHMDVYNEAMRKAR